VNVAEMGSIPSRHPKEKMIVGKVEIVGGNPPDNLVKGMQGHLYFTCSANIMRVHFPDHPYGCGTYDFAYTDDSGDDKGWWWQYVKPISGPILEIFEDLFNERPSSKG
jgi:hypothetical protein